MRAKQKQESSSLANANSSNSLNCVASSFLSLEIIIQCPLAGRAGSLCTVVEAESALSVIEWDLPVMPYLALS